VRCRTAHLAQYVLCQTVLRRSSFISLHAYWRNSHRFFRRTPRGPVKPQHDDHHPEIFTVTGQTKVPVNNPVRDSAVFKCAPRLSHHQGAIYVGETEAVSIGGDSSFGYNAALSGAGGRLTTEHDCRTRQKADLWWRARCLLVSASGVSAIPYGHESSAIHWTGRSWRNVLSHSHAPHHDLLCEMAARQAMPSLLFVGGI